MRNEASSSQRHRGARRATENCNFLEEQQTPRNVLRGARSFHQEVVVLCGPLWSSVVLCVSVMKTPSPYGFTGKGFGGLFLKSPALTADILAGFTYCLIVAFTWSAVRAVTRASSA